MQQNIHSRSHGARLSFVILFAWGFQSAVEPSFAQGTVGVVGDAVAKPVVSGKICEDAMDKILLNYKLGTFSGMALKTSKDTIEGDRFNQLRSTYAGGEGNWEKVSQEVWRTRGMSKCIDTNICTEEHRKVLLTAVGNIKGYTPSDLTAVNADVFKKNDGVERHRALDNGSYVFRHELLKNADRATVISHKLGSSRIEAVVSSNGGFISGVDISSVGTNSIENNLYHAEFENVAGHCQLKSMHGQGNDWKSGNAYFSLDSQRCAQLPKDISLANPIPKPELERMIQALANANIGTAEHYHEQVADQPKTWPRFIEGEFATYRKMCDTFADNLAPSSPAVSARVSTEASAPASR